MVVEPPPPPLPPPLPPLPPLPPPLWATALTQHIAIAMTPKIAILDIARISFASIIVVVSFRLLARRIYCPIAMFVN
jgi:hypothetical protein